MRVGLYCVILFVLATILFFASANPASAATRTWDGGGTTNDWNEAANWSSNTVPVTATGDLAVFDGTSTKDATINVSVTLGAISINSGYTGIITQGTGNTVTLATANGGAGTFTISAGTFTGGNSNITVPGTFTVSGGTFTSTTATLAVQSFTVSSGTFNESTGTVSTSGSGNVTWNVVTTETFNNVTFTKNTGNSVTISSGDTLVVTGTLTVNGGIINTGTIDARGNITQSSANANGGSATIDFGDNSVNQTYTISAGTSPIIRFDSSSDANDSLTFTGAGTVAGLNITSGFSGTIPISNASDFALVFDSWTQDAGTYSASSQSNWTIGNFTQTAGSFTAPTTITNPQGITTWNFVTTQTFNNVTINKGNGQQLTISSGDTLVVSGTLTLTNGIVNTGTIDARGAISQGSGFDGGTAIIDFGDDAGSDTYTINGGIAPSIRFNSAADASDSLTFAAAATVDSLLITSGFSGTIPISNSSNFALTFNTWTQDAGTYDASAQSSWSFNDLTISGGSFTAPALTTVVGGTASWDVVTTQTFANLTVAQATGNTMAIGSGDTLVVTGTLTLTEGFVNTGTLDARGAISQASTFDGGTATVDFGDDAGSDTYTVNGGTSPSIRFDSAADASDSLTFAAAPSSTEGMSVNITSGFSGTVPISNSSDFTLTFERWIQDGGTYDASAQSAWNIRVFTRTGGSFTAPDLITITGSAASWDVATSQTLENLTINKSGSTAVNFTAGDTYTITGNLNFTNGAANNAVLSAQGNVTVASTWDSGDSILEFSGTATQSFTLTGATALWDGVTRVNKTGGQVNLASALVMDDTTPTQNLTIIEGKLNTAGNNLTVNASGATFTVEDGGNFQLQGGETITLVAGQPTLDSGSTVTYIGNGNAGANTFTITTLKTTYHHLTINSTDGATDTFQLGAALDVNGNMTITAGTVDVVSGQNRAITLGGNWSNGGTFNAQAGTVTMDGTSQSISGSTTFFNFSKTVTSAATLTFAASATQTFTGTMTLLGDSAINRLALRSSSSPTQAKIDPQGTRTVAFLDVQDIDNDNATAISCDEPGCLNSGNNENWSFGEEAQSLTFSISDNTIGFGALSSSAARFATGDTNGSASDSADAHTISASTNAGSGYVITVNGATLTNTVNATHTVTAIGGSAAASSAGTEQFGLRLIVNSGSGSATAPYASSNWALDTASFPDEVASGNGDDVETQFGVRYIANIAPATQSGNYSSTLTYTITATF